MARTHWKQIGLMLLIGSMVCSVTYAGKSKQSMESQIEQIEKDMRDAAKKLDFERAASLRDKLKQLKTASPAEQIEKQMWEAAKKLDFERAASLRDMLQKAKASKKGNKNPGNNDQPKKKSQSKVKQSDEDADKGESERKVTRAEVPTAALATLKKLAAGAKITEFAEEMEHGHTFYEGSWKASSGANMDVLVTPTGALVEIEEEVGADKVPVSVLKVAQKVAGKGAKLAFEKKTMILYEVKFAKDKARHELLLTPDGRRVEEEVEKSNPGGDDDDDDRNMKAIGNDDDDDDDDDEDEDADDEDDDEEDEDGDDEDEDDEGDDEDDDEDEDADDEDDDEEDEDADDDDGDEDDDEDDDEEDDD